MRKFYRALVIAVVPLIAFSVFISSTPQVLAATAGPEDAGTGANVAIGSNTDWSSPGNITTSGTPYATSIFANGTNTDYLRGTDYGFSIPAGAIINGIQVVINRSGTQIVSVGVRDNAVYLVKDVSGVPVVQTSGDNKAKSTTWPTSLATDTYGSTSDGSGPTAKVLGATDTSLPRTGGMPIEGMLYLSWLGPVLERFRQRRLKK